MRIIFGLLGIVGLVLAVMYFTMPSSSLPLPDALGHQAGSSTIHAKHGILALVVGVGCLVVAYRTRTG
jgi:hypothetical protein